ncbi:hypothetical protein [Desulfogranum japonicum]|uniref:hypothetical protein n=1 Tax=Desulfogranum japonicum TaxID=231447 RepID=UPI0004138869|nr:hypothetical protein [Desulfogranum japonicum]
MKRYLTTILGRIFIHSVATVLLTLFVWQKFEGYYHTKGPVAGFFPYLIVVILICYAWRQFSRISTYRTRIKMAQHPAAFSPDKIDCYVSVQGTLLGENIHVSPLKGEPCAYYRSEIFAEWETKKRKPNRGMETQRKPLLKDSSADELKILVQDQPVYVRTTDFPQKWMQLRTYEKTREKCPAQIIQSEKSKYKKYQVYESYACNGDSIMAQGKLTRFTDGRLFIVPSGLHSYPSFIISKVKRTRGAQLVKEIVGEAMNMATIKRLDAWMLVINAILLLYISTTGHQG